MDAGRVVDVAFDLECRVPDDVAASADEPARVVDKHRATVRACGRLVVVHAEQSMPPRGLAVRGLLVVPVARAGIEPATVTV